MHLKNIFTSDDIKSLTSNELGKLSQEIRSRIIQVMAKNGGHLGSNLGCVEIIVALHNVFDVKKTPFIFDVSHQTYTHKLLTSRQEKFEKIRQENGLSGFAHPKESPYDYFYSGHAGCALSQALGMIYSNQLINSKHPVIAIIGDAALSCGLTLEALNHVYKKTRNLIVVLNDNAMSISHGVGTIHKDILGKFSIPRKLNKNAKAFFEQFNFEYCGPINGHNLEALISTLKKAKASNGPILVHAHTIKGYGLEKAQTEPIDFHGVKPFDQKTCKFYPNPSKNQTFPNAFGQHIYNLLAKNEHLILITPAMSKGSCLDDAMKTFPNRVIDVGIAEGHALTFASGLAKKGKHKIVVSIYATFLQRALDNLFHDICIQNLPIIIALDRSGLSCADGPTHHGIYDMAFLIAMPNLVIAQPRDERVLKELMNIGLCHKTPFCIRYPNLSTKTNTTKEPIKFGKGQILKKGKRVAIICLGHMYNLAFAVEDELNKHNIHASIIDPVFIKPLDTELLFDIFIDHSLVVTIEEHNISTGLGSSINNFATSNSLSGIQILNFGLKDCMIEHGNYKTILKNHGLCAESISKKIQESLSVSQLQKELVL